MSVLEIVTFKTVARARDATALDAARAGEPALRRYAGFPVAAETAAHMALNDQAELSMRRFAVSVRQR